MKLEYGTGNARALAVRDSLWFGGMEAKNQYLLELQKLRDMSDFQGDGLVGMGFASLDKGHLTVIDNLFE